MYPVTPVKFPVDLQSEENGKLSPSLLVSVGPSGQMHHNAARSWRALVSDLTNHGFQLTYTYGGMYRPYVGQEWLFKSRYSPNGTFGGCKIWNGVKWCKTGNYASAAVPGTSNHGWALAVDMALDMTWEDGSHPEDASGINPALSYLLTVVEKYGFSWEDQTEPWHIRYVLGDAVPEATLIYEFLINPPLEVEEVSYTLYRDKRFLNVFRVGDTAITIGQGLFNVDMNAKVPYVQDVHDQSLIAYMRSSNLTMLEMVPSHEPNLPEFKYPDDLI